MPDELRHFPMLRAVTGDEQGNLQRRLVGEETMRGLAVIAKRFTMIGGDDDQRVRIGSHDRAD